MNTMQTWDEIDSGLGAAPPDDGTEKSGFWTWLGSELTSGLTSVKEGLTAASKDNWAAVKAENERQLALARERTNANIQGAQRIQESRLSSIVGSIKNDPGKAALYVAGGAALLGVLVLVMRRK